MIDWLSMCTFTNVLEISFHLHVAWFFVHCSCLHLQNQRHNFAVVEAAAFTLSQLLQAEDTAEKIIPFVPSFFSRFNMNFKKQEVSCLLKPSYIEKCNQLTLRLQDGSGLQFTSTVVVSPDSRSTVWPGTCNRMCMVSALPLLQVRTKVKHSFKAAS